MAKTIAEMKQDRFGLYTKMKDMLNKADTEKREMTADENAEYNKIDKEVDKLTEDIQRREKMDTMERELAEKKEKEERQNQENKKNGTVRTIDTDEYKSAFRQFIIEPSQITPEQRKMLLENRALSAVTGASGGYTVPQGFYNKITEAMKYYGGMRQARTTKMPTASGNDIPVPTSDDTSNVGELVGESAPVSGQDIAFGQVLLKAYKYSSKSILVPIELLQDSAFDIESFLARKLGERIGRIQNTHFTTGDNSSKPQGVVVGATLGKTGASGQTTSIILDDLIDLEHSVDIYYRQQAEFMFNDSTLKALKKMKDQEGRLIWVPGLAVKEPDTILGHPYIINNDVAAMAASAKSILFGDFSNYWIRDVKAIELYRISEKYIENGQIGFLAFSRSDGRMVDAGQHPIKYYINAAS